jgi:hypothetical protein
VNRRGSEAENREANLEAFIPPRLLKETHGKSAE